MGGHVIGVIPERVLDFSSLAMGQTQELIIAQEIDVLQWREATHMLRVFDHTLSGGSGTITISTYAQSLSAQDPGMFFIDKNNPNDMIIDSATPLNAYKVGVMDVLGRGATMAVIARGARTGSGAIIARVSLELSVKDA